MNKAKRYIIIIIMILFLATTRFSLSYLMTSSESENEFILGTINPVVLETVDKSEKTKKDIKVKNNGNSDIFVRVNIIYNFNDEDNNIIGVTPIIDTDYTVQASSPNWIKDENDGYYYYKYAVSPNETTDNLIDEIKILYNGNDKHVVVNVLAEAIQASPTRAISELWHKHVVDNVIVIEG